MKNKQALILLISNKTKKWLLNRFEKVFIYKPADNPCPLELNVKRSHPIDIKIQSMDQKTIHSNMPLLGIWYKKAKLILPRDACVHRSWSDKGCLPFQGLMFQWLHFLSEKKNQNWQTCIGFVLVGKPDQIQNQFVAAYTRSVNSDSYNFAANIVSEYFYWEIIGPKLLPYLRPFGDRFEQNF